MAQIDPAKIGGWYEAHAPKLLLFVRQWLSFDAANDVVQDVFVQLIRQRKEPDNIRAWLFRVARNAVISRMRSRSRRQKRETIVAERKPQWFEQKADDLVDAQMVTEHLQSISSQQREVIVMRIWGGLTFDEIASVTESSKATVFRRHRDGLQAIKEAMEKSCTKKTN